jgi:hypothetical protein
MTYELWRLFSYKFVTGRVCQLWSGQVQCKPVAYLFRCFRNTSSVSGSPQRGFEPICSGIQVMFVTVVVSLPRFTWQSLSLQAVMEFPITPVEQEVVQSFFTSTSLFVCVFVWAQHCSGSLCCDETVHYKRAIRSVWDVQQWEWLLDVTRPTIRSFTHYLCEAVGMKAWRDYHVCLSICPSGSFFRAI